MRAIYTKKMSTKQQLLDSIQQYEKQLAEVKKALATTNGGRQRQELREVKNSIIELLELTRETIECEHGTADASASNNIDDEVALFMSEINQLEGPSVPKPSEQKTVEVAADNFKDLVGSKCLAPFVFKWGSKSHHNALVCSVDASNVADVKVKVLFINPVHQEMVPCPYFLDGKCQFNEKCRFSHGHIVPFNELRDYREPKFELLNKKGRSVLVKNVGNNIWSRAIVKEANFLNKKCRLLREDNKNEVFVPFEDIYPLFNEGDDDEDDIDGVSIADSEPQSSGEEVEEDMAAVRKALIVQRSLLNPVPSQRLGEWEKHTKGIGSKLMQKMGYVFGAGLGSMGEGIVVPIGAQVLPQGRSLDYCMELREKANGDSDLFSVEKKLMREKRIQEKRDANKTARAAQKTDIFSFLNSKILGTSGGPSSSSSSSSGKTSDGQNHNKLDLPKCSSKNLNIASLVASDNARRLESDIEKLTHSLTRHQPGTRVHSSLMKQIADKRAEKAQMQAKEISISREQRLRSDQRKMTVF